MRYLLFCCAIAMACNNDTPAAMSNDSTSTATSDVQIDTATAIITPSCYAHQTSNNLVLLKLNTVRPTVSGHLTYDIMGKDKNEGMISGTMRGDTLFAEYNFMSGEKHFMRKVAFLRKGDSFVEGYGDFQQKGESIIFSNSDTLDFNGPMILEQVPCPPDK